MSLTPTELGKKLGIGVRSVNKLLKEKGLQEEAHYIYPSLNHATVKSWKPTEKGKKYASSSNGNWPGLRWAEEVIDILKK